MKKTLKYIGTRVIILIIFTLSIVSLYEYVFYKKTLEKDGWLKLKGESVFAKKPDILYFSASPNKSYDVNEDNHLSIHEFIREKLPDFSIESLDTGAIHAAIFYHALTQFPKAYKPKAIVMDLNLRSFGVNWQESDLENALQLNISYWNNRPGLINRLNAALKNYDFVPNSERNQRIVYQHDFVSTGLLAPYNTVRNWCRHKTLDSKTESELSFIRAFGFEITATNKMLKAYQKIEDWCQKENIPLIFVFLPENMEYMKNDVCTQLSELCLSNRTKIIDLLKEKAVILDLVNTLDGHYFFEPFPTEHYFAEGREFIAEKIACTLQEKLKQ